MPAAEKRTGSTPTRAWFALASLLMAASVTTIAWPAQPQKEPSVRLIRSTSGTRGTQQGSRFVIEDPRSVFSPSTDRQIVVHFEWEGRPGLHRCEGRWKDPTGRVVLTAPHDQRATSARFGVYWTLAIPETAAAGLWALEAWVDGELSGTHTFELKGAADVASVREMPTAELYRQGLAAIATVESQGAAGQLLASGPAVAIGGDHLLTSFWTIEGAASLRFVLGDGRRVETREMLAWNRRQDWALVSLNGHGLKPLPRAEPRLWAVGDRYWVIDSLEDGGRVIQEASIVGTDPASPGRPRLNSGHAAGSPVLDGQGRLFGVVAGSGPEARLGSTGLSILLGAKQLRGSLIVPLDSVAVPATAAATPLSQLMASGQFLRPLSLDQRHVISGVFAGRVERSGAVPMPMDQRAVFSRREEEVSVFVQWDPHQKKDAQMRFEIYDLDNSRLGAGRPVKIKLRPGQYLFSTWTFRIADLPPGTYRVDLLLDDSPIWRGYVRVTD
jgi:hypothetical protein